jgi:hypothetical protein
MFHGRSKIDGFHAVICPRSSVVRGIPGEDLGAYWCDGMLVEVVVHPHEPFICGYGRVVFERSDDVKCHLYLRKTLVQVKVRTMGVEASPRGYNVVLSCSNRAFSPIRVFNMWWN